MREWRWVLFVVSWSAFSAWCYGVEHPVHVDATTNCVECHADHAEGKYVHAAIAQGCLACHAIEERGEATYIVLKPAKTILCFECHTPQHTSHAHFPYASAMCLRCHNPHSAENPRLLRAKVNELCLGCHLRTPGNNNSRYMPAIALTVNNTQGHPYERHPVGGTVDPLTGSEMSCVSCHMPHGGAGLHYLKMGSEIPEDALNQSTETNDMCHKCHLRLWGLDGIESQKKKKHKLH